ncbi:MAG: sodium:solute symporter family protein [Eubacteriales bacterium]|nr:sodium:solute symporter family protein [Eubacteriales bacterium]
MHNIIILTSIILIAMVILFIFLGIWFKRMVKSSEDFLLAGRKAPFWLLACSYLGGTVGGASVSGYTGMGHGQGIGAMWTSMFLISGTTIFIVLFARRLNYFGRKTGAVTISDFACARYGEGLRLPVALCSFLRPSILTGMQFLAIAVALNVVLGLALPVGVACSAGVILLYMVTGGQYSAMVNQLIQSLFQSVGIMLFATAAFKIIGSPTDVYLSMKATLPSSFMTIWETDFSLVSVWFMTMGLFYLVDPWGYMWAYVGETPRVSSNAQLAILGGSYYNVLPFLAGMSIAVGAAMGYFVVPEGLSGDSFYVWFSSSQFPMGIAVFILVGLLMTIISCGSSFAMNGVTIVTRDIYQKSLNKNASPKQMLIASRVSVFIVVTFGIVCALWLPILVPLWVLAQALVVSGLLAPILSAWFWRRATKQGAKASCIGGIVTALSWAIYAWVNTGSPGGMMYGLHAAHVGLMVSIPLMIIVSLATKPDFEASKATHYVDLGRDMGKNVLDPAITKGFFGWLGAHKPYEKIFWVIVFSIFALHFILAFLFHVEVAGIAYIWIASIIGIAMIFLLGTLGFRDVFHLVRDFKEENPG